MRLNAQHLAEPGGLFEPQRANNGILIIPDLTGWNDADSAPVTLALESFPLPKESNVQIEARYMNERRKFAGPANVEDMEVVVKDMVDVDVALVLLRWRRMVYNPARISDSLGVHNGVEIIAGGGEALYAGAVGLAKNYKKSGRIILIAPDNSSSREYEVEGLWPMSMDPGDIDMTSEDFIRVSITLSVDRIRKANLVTPNA